MKHLSDLEITIIKTRIEMICMMDADRRPEWMHKLYDDIDGFVENHKNLSFEKGRLHQQEKININN